MPSFDEKSNVPEQTIAVPGASQPSNDYRLVYANKAAERDFTKAYARLPKADVDAIRAALKGLKDDPRQGGKKCKHLALPKAVGDCVAQFRLRVGNYRVFYDVQDAKRHIVLITVARRNSKTYA